MSRFTSSPAVRDSHSCQPEVLSKQTKHLYTIHDWPDRISYISGNMQVEVHFLWAQPWTSWNKTSELFYHHILHDFSNNSFHVWSLAKCYNYFILLIILLISQRNERVCLKATSSSLSSQQGVPGSMFFWLNGDPSEWDLWKTTCRIRGLRESFYRRPYFSRSGVFYSDQLLRRSFAWEAIKERMFTHRTTAVEVSNGRCGSVFADYVQFSGHESKHPVWSILLLRVDTLTLHWG